MAKDINPNSRSPFVKPDGGLTRYGMEVILKLYRALQFTGTTSVIETISADISDIESDITSLQATTTSQGASIAALQAEVALIGDYPLVVATSNYITAGRAFIVVTNPAVIVTLNSSPDDGEQVVIHHNAGTGNYIDVTDGTGTDRIVADQAVLTYRYSTTLGDWVRGA